MPSVYVKTMGCKVNTFDSRVIENQLKDEGYVLQAEPHEPDITVVNTCSVTAQADREARYLARRLKRDFPSTLLVFTGCYAQTDSARLAAMDEIDLVVPNEGKEHLVQFIRQRLENRGQSDHAADETVSFSSKIPPHIKPVSENRQNHFKSSLTFFDRSESQQTRAFLKIQDGCNGFCSYCLIPYARGQSRSVPYDKVLLEVQRILRSGIYEIVLTGIHIGDYGRDLAREGASSQLGGLDSPDPIVPLVDEILSQPELGRLRISSLEPLELTPELVEVFVKHRDKVCPHFHLPLQSGSAEILKKMRRTYDPHGYREAVERIRAAFPDVCIGADVIPGFPGESEEHFQETVSLIQDLRLSYLHVFPYSKRPNTAAAKMPHHLDGSLVHQRAKVLRQLSAKLWRQYTSSFVGTYADVLWEGDLDSKGRRLGRTANYLRVAASIDGKDPSTPVRQGQVSRVLLKGFISESPVVKIAASPPEQPQMDAEVGGEMGSEGSILLGKILSCHLSQTAQVLGH